MAKSQIHALDRTQPDRPLKKRLAAAVIHNYKRKGTTILFATLNVRVGLDPAPNGASAD